MVVIKDHSNLIGDVSGERVIIKDLGRKLESPKGRKTRHYVLVRCSCGNEQEIRYLNFHKSSRCTSCSNRKLNSEYTVTHGKTDTKVYSVWQSMKKRTSNPKAANYNHYGGRGIKMCERWNKFENFYEDMGEPPSNKHTLDRIDVNGDYCPKNCCWATMKEQCRNKRSNAIYEGKCIAEWAEILGCSYKFAYYHIAKKGKSPSDVKSLWTSRQEGNE